jgi:hypothetical protein
VRHRPYDLCSEKPLHPVRCLLHLLHPPPPLPPRDKPLTRSERQNNRISASRYHEKLAFPEIPGRTEIRLAPPWRQCVANADKDPGKKLAHARKKKINQCAIQGQGENISSLKAPLRRRVPLPPATRAPGASFLPCLVKPPLLQLRSFSRQSLRTSSAKAGF